MNFWFFFLLQRHLAAISSLNGWKKWFQRTDKLWHSKFQRNRTLFVATRIFFLSFKATAPNQNFGIQYLEVLTWCERTVACAALTIRERSSIRAIESFRESFWRAYSVIEVVDRARAHIAAECIQKQPLSSAGSWRKSPSKSHQATAWFHFSSCLIRWIEIILSQFIAQFFPFYETQKVCSHKSWKCLRRKSNRN